MNVRLFVFLVIIGIGSCNGQDKIKVKFQTCLDSEIYEALKNFDVKLNESKLVDSTSLTTYFHYFNRKTFTPEILHLTGEDVNGLSTPSVFFVMTKCCFAINQGKINSDVAAKYILMVEKNDASPKRMTEIFESMVDDPMSVEDKRIIAAHLIWASWYLRES